MQAFPPECSFYKQTDALFVSLFFFLCSTCKLGQKSLRKAQDKAFGDENWPAQRVLSCSS